MMDKKELEIMEMEMIAGGIETPHLGDPPGSSWDDVIIPNELNPVIDRESRMEMIKMMDKKELTVEIM